MFAELCLLFFLVRSHYVEYETLTGIMVSELVFIKDLEGNSHGSALSSVLGFAWRN